MDNQKNKILITPSTFGELDKEPLEKLIKKGFGVVNNPFSRKLTVKELRDLLPEAIGLIAGLEKIDREVMKNSKLKVISRVGTGIENIDLEAAKELGIIVKNTPDAPTVAVSELTLGAILSLLRMIPQLNDALHKRKWNKRVGVQLAGKTVVIIGFGRIGRAVARLLKPFGVELLAVDHLYQGIVDEVPIVSLEKALPRADIITLHLSGSEEVLGKSEFSKMKNGVFILNAARGEVIEEKALIEALKEGKVAGAWLDTFWQEPYQGPLCEFPQVLLTPHVGSYTRECRKRMEMEAVDNLLSVLGIDVNE